MEVFLKSFGDPHGWDGSNGQVISKIKDMGYGANATKTLRYMMPFSVSIMPYNWSNVLETVRARYPNVIRNSCDYIWVDRLYDMFIHANSDLNSYFQSRSPNKILGTLLSIGHNNEPLSYWRSYCECILMWCDPAAQKIPSVYHLIGEHSLPLSEAFRTSPWFNEPQPVRLHAFYDLTRNQHNQAFIKELKQIIPTRMIGKTRNLNGEFLVYWDGDGIRVRLFAPKTNSNQLHFYHVKGGISASNLYASIIPKWVPQAGPPPVPLRWDLHGCETVLTPSQTAALNSMAIMHSKSIVEHFGRFILPGLWAYPNTHRVFNTRLSDGQERLKGGINALQTGDGKTLVALLWALNLPGSVLIIVPNPLLKQWNSEIAKHLPDSRQQFESFRFTHQFKKFVNTKKVFPKVVLMARCVAMTKFPSNFNHFIADEAHSLPGSIINALNREQKDSTSYRSFFGITATYAREYVKLQKIMGIPPAISRNYFEQKLVALSLPPPPGFEPRFNLSVKKRYCRRTEEEQRQIDKVYLVLMSGGYNQRIFRILERLCTGGLLHMPSVLQLIKWNNLPQSSSSSSSLANLSQRLLAVQSGSPPSPPFADIEADNCAICVCDFKSPVQLECGHVFCKECISVCFQVTRNTCPHCRRLYQRPVKVWKADGDAPAAPPPPPPPPSAPTEEKKFLSLREATRGAVSSSADHKASEWVIIRGKEIAFERDLTAWWGTPVADPFKPPCLVIYVKSPVAAVRLGRIMDRLHIPFLSAGHHGIKLHESVDNIERFRRRESRVLLISPKFSDGFDLCTASDLWIMNSDIRVSKMVQEQGRITRLSQENANVSVKIFVYRHEMDEMLWDMRKDIEQQPHMGQGKVNLINLYYQAKTNAVKRVYYRFLQRLSKVQQLEGVHFKRYGEFYIQGFHVGSEFRIREFLHLNDRDFQRFVQVNFPVD